MFKGLHESTGGNFWQSMEASHGHLAMFGGNWSSASGDIKYLICHMNSQNHLDQVALWVGILHGMSPLYQVWLP